jgi:tRNA(fMet)-specific endonuclease VapC
MLDTNICIYVIKQHAQSIIGRFKPFPVGDIGISVITLAELQYGASKSSQPKKNHEALEEFISPLEVADCDGRASAVYGQVRALGELDLKLPVPKLL